ncbi:MAG: hypothetical protein ACHBN1_35565 [Heteroscytonema crispum UTEX LB 1556]
MVLVKLSTNHQPPTTNPRGVHQSPALVLPDRSAPSPPTTIYLTG